MGQGGTITQVVRDVFGREDATESAQLTASLGGAVTLYQCVALPAGANVDFGGWVEIPSFQEVTGSAVVRLEWWSDPACTETQLDVPAETATATATGRWSALALRGVTPPVGAREAKLRATNLPNATGFQVRFDSLFVAAAGALFVPQIGDLVEADGWQKIVKVETSAGVQRLVTSGVYLARPTGVAIGADGKIWVTCPVGTPLVAVDPATGAQEPPATSGATLASPWDIDAAPDGSFWIAGNGLWQLEGSALTLRKALPSVAYGMHVDPDWDAGGSARLVALALGSAGLTDYEAASGDLVPVGSTPSAAGRYDYGVWTPPSSGTRVFTEIEPIAPSGCNAAASGVRSVDDGLPLPDPSLDGSFRCPRGLAVGDPDAPGFVSDASAFTGSQEGQIISIERNGQQTLVTRGGFLVDPWDLEVVPEPHGLAAGLAVLAALAVRRRRSFTRR
jgi:MYXO-CTERM domain-containing protein